MCRRWLRPLWKLYLCSNLLSEILVLSQHLQKHDQPSTSNQAEWDSDGCFLCWALQLKTEQRGRREWISHWGRTHSPLVQVGLPGTTDHFPEELPFDLCSEIKSRVFKFFWKCSTFISRKPENKTQQSTVPKSWNDQSGRHRERDTPKKPSLSRVVIREDTNHLNHSE